MKTAKAYVLMFDLRCPECDGLLLSPEGHGSMTWAANESAPPVAVCSDCGVKSRVPKRVAGCEINIKEDA